MLVARKKLDRWENGEVTYHPETLRQIALTATDSEEEAQEYYNAQVIMDMNARRAIRLARQK